MQEKADPVFKRQVNMREGVIVSLQTPFHRTIRSHSPSDYAGYSSWSYIRDPEFAKMPANYLRAFLIIQSDFERLCEYVEPSAQSLPTFSYRIHELLMRVCVEVEANLKAILQENTYTGSTFNMGVYRKVDVTHHLSSYTLTLSTWHGSRRLIRPFESWLGPHGFGTGRRPEWYDSYNASKHDRREAFKRANMEQLIDALAGLLALVSSQFGTESFSAAGDVLGLSGNAYEDLSPATGALFRIGFPQDWSEGEKYDFDWTALSQQPVRFSKIDYDRIQVG